MNPIWNNPQKCLFFHSELIFYSNNHWKAVSACVLFY